MVANWQALREILSFECGSGCGYIIARYTKGREWVSGCLKLVFVDVHLSINGYGFHFER